MSKVDRITCIQILRSLIEEIDKRQLPYLRKQEAHFKTTNEPMIEAHFARAGNYLQDELWDMRRQIDEHITLLAKGE